MNEPKFYKTEPIDFDDPLLELLPEAYLDTVALSGAELADAANELSRQTAASLVRFGGEFATSTKQPQAPKLSRFLLSELFDLKPGIYHSLNSLPRGQIPIVSCGDIDNGICGYYDVDDGLHEGKMTIAFNGSNPLNAKFHPYRFAAKDDVAVCLPRTPLRITTLLFIQLMLGRETWRYNYYRKCYRDKLSRITVLLPAKKKAIDEDAIEAILQGTAYWGFLKDRLQNGTA